MFGEDENPDELRKEMLDECYAAAFAGGFGAALFEAADIEMMSDDEVVEEARKRGM